MLDQLAWLADRGIPVLFVYGDEENDYDEFTEARQGRLGEILDSHTDKIRLEVVPGSVHGMDRTDTQDRVQEVVTAWAAEVADRASRPSPPDFLSPAGGVPDAKGLGAGNGSLPEVRKPLVEHRWEFGSPLPTRSAAGPFPPARGTENP